MSESSDLNTIEFQKLTKAFNPTEVASDILNKFSIERPPVDLGIICEELGDISIKGEEIEGDGYLLYLGDGKYAIIYNNKTKISNKYRFTIAHELGHFMLNSFAVREGYSSNSIFEKSGTSVHDNSEVERWCDVFSRDLLLPEKWIRDRFKSSESLFNHSLLLSSPDFFKVSGDFFFRRMVELFTSSYNLTIIIIEYRFNNKTNQAENTRNFPFSFNKKKAQSILNLFNNSILKENQTILIRDIWINNFKTIVVLKKRNQSQFP